MKTQKSKRRLVVLPAEFQEVLIHEEVKFDKQETCIENIRKLVYLYSVSD